MIYYIGSQEWEGISHSSIDECIAYLSSLEHVCLDSETLSLDPHTGELLLLQVGDRHNQYVINCKENSIEPLKSLLESKVILMHNSKFDYQIMFHEGIDIKYIFDTFLAECILTTGYDSKKRDVSLKGICKKYLDIDMDKSERSHLKYELTKEGIIYAATDIMYLEDLMELQLQQIEKYGLQKVMDLENRVVRVFARMEYEGVLFDSTKLSGVITEIKSNTERLINQMDAFVISSTDKYPELRRFTKVQLDLFDEVRPSTINWRSPAQKVDILNAVGINVNSVSDKVLSNLKVDLPLIQLFKSYSKFSKLESSFGEVLNSFVNPITGRIHGSVWQILSTGRISMSEPNLQQIPAHSELGKRIKACFIAPEGKKFVSADFSGFELRIIAEYSQDPLWVKTFLEGGDLHSILCAETFSIPLEDVKKPFPYNPDISYRFLQKTLNFGLSYGMTEHKFSEEAMIPVKESKKIIEKFFSKVPKVEEFLNDRAKDAVKAGFIRTDLVYKRIRWFPHLNREDIKSSSRVERQAKNSIPQGTNANVMKQALCDLQDIIDENNYPVKILLSVHDEIITECDEAFAEQWKEILSTTMINAAKLVIKSIPVSVDAVVNDYWTD